MTCHQSGVMRWRCEQEVLQTSLHLVYFRTTPRPFKCQMLLLVNETNVSEGVLHRTRWEQCSRVDNCFTLQKNLLSKLHKVFEPFQFLKLSWITEFTRVMRHEHAEKLQTQICIQSDLHSLLRACAHSSVQPVNLLNYNACGGLRMLDRLAPSPGLWLPTPV